MCMVMRRRFIAKAEQKPTQHQVVNGCYTRTFGHDSTLYADTCCLHTEYIYDWLAQTIKAVNNKKEQGVNNNKT